MLCIVESEFRNSTDPPRTTAITCGTYLHPTWSNTTGAGVGPPDNIAAGGPLLIYTYTFPSLPSFTAYCSAKLSAAVIEHTGSIDISIFTGSGAFPANRIVPVTIPSAALSSCTVGVIFGVDVSGTVLSPLCFTASLGLHPLIALHATAPATNQPQIRLIPPRSNLFLEKAQPSH